MISFFHADLDETTKFSGGVLGTSYPHKNRSNATLVKSLNFYKLLNYQLFDLANQSNILPS